MPIPTRRLLAASLTATLVVACTTPSAPDRPLAATPTPTAGATAPTEPPTSDESREPTPSTTTEEPVVLLAAGDIAACDRDGDEATARLLDERPGVVAALGDLAYPDGTSEQLQACYGPTWGRHRDRTRPALGNHDLHTGDAPWFDYFGSAGGPRRTGYYAYDLGDHWRAVVLNTNCWAVGGCGPGSAQYEWLQAELVAHADRHVVAYGHHPRWSSGHHGSNAFLADMFGVLDRAGVALYLAGHDHHYERFEPVDEFGTPDPDGVRQFVAGTGGYVLYALGRPLPTTEVRTNASFGILELQLLPDRYRWRFHPTEPDAPGDRGETRVD